MKWLLSDPSAMPPWRRRLEEGVIWAALVALVVAVWYSLLI
jgi:hypothetical protein